MSTVSISAPYPIFTDIDGNPLEDGFIYIGQPNQNPQVNPIDVFWDSGLTIPAVQPIRTIGGYPVRSGTPSRLYTSGDFSTTVRNKNGSLVYTSPVSTDIFDAASLSGTFPSGRVTFTQSGTDAVARTAEDKFLEAVSVKDFIPFGYVTASNDCSEYFQAAIDSLSAAGGMLFVPKGIYLISAPVKTRNGVIIMGEGDASQLLATTDIEVINSDTTTVSSAVFQAEFRDFFIKKTVTGATTKYDIHLQNPSICLFEHVHVQSGHDDNSYSETNVGGIWLDKPDASTTACFMNRLIDCWIQNNSIYFRNVTDSVVNGGYVWGHTRQFAIRFYGGGANAIENVIGIICSKYNGGIWLDGSSQNQIRIRGNEFDGNPLLDTGYGVYCPQGSLAGLITGNTFWGCDKHGVWLKDAVAWTITGNNFYKGNAGDGNYDDIRLESVAYSTNSNTVTGNTFIIDEARANKGFAINEVNSGGGAPSNNCYVGNTIFGAGYTSKPFNIIGNSNVQGNGGAYQIPDRTSSGKGLYGSTAAGYEPFCGVILAVNQLVAAAGTMDLEVNTDSFLGNPGGFVGMLAVTATRYDFAAQSRRTLYSVVCRGTTATFTQLVNQDGSGGGSAFTVTMASDGVIRFTDTSASGSLIAASMVFTGSRSLA